MKNFFSNIVLCSLLVLTISYGCNKKPGVGGKASIKGLAALNNKEISSAAVFIKYGTTDFPGKDLTQYDDIRHIGKDGKFEFKNLSEGKYYLYVEAMVKDELVTGGVNVELNNENIENIYIPLEQISLK